MQEGKFKTLQDVARFCGVDKSTVDRWKSKIPLKKREGFYHESEVLEWREKVSALYVQEPRRGNPVIGIVSPVGVSDEEEEDPEEEAIAVTNHEYAKARLQEKRAKAKLAELQYNEKKGEVIPRDDVVLVLTDFAESLKSSLQRLDSQLAKSVVGVDAVEAQKRIRDAVNHELLTLGGGSWLKEKKSSPVWQKLCQTVSNLLQTAILGSGGKSTASTPST